MCGWSMVNGQSKKHTFESYFISKKKQWKSREIYKHTHIHTHTVKTRKIKGKMSLKIAQEVKVVLMICNKWTIFVNGHFVFENQNPTNVYSNKKNIEYPFVVILLCILRVQVRIK